MHFPDNPIVRDRGSRTPAAAMAVAVAVALLAPAAARAQAPALPGPPPGAGGPPPLASSVLRAAAPLPPVTLVPAAPGPGLLATSARVSKARIPLALSCQARGEVSVVAPRLQRKPVGTGAYRCSAGRTSVSLGMPQRAARRLRALGLTAARVIVRQRGARTVLPLTLRSGSARDAQAPGDAWTDGRLQCAEGANGEPQAELVAPNWTARPATRITVRPWLAWFTPANGWRWLGARGPWSTNWYRWTATPSGVAEWRDAAAADVVNPWTWGPITLPLEPDTFVVGAFEVVYWWGGAAPTVVWNYVRATGPGADAAGRYCGAA
jgi:hypothetical protein